MVSPHLASGAVCPDSGIASHRSSPSPATPSGRRYRDELGRLNTRVAAESDQVLLVTAGLAQRLK